MTTVVTTEMAGKIGEKDDGDKIDEKNGEEIAGKNAEESLEKGNAKKGGKKAEKKKKKKTLQMQLPKYCNAAVEAVGPMYFLVSMAGVIVSALLAILVVVLGVVGHFFKWEMDRCDCLPKDPTCVIGEEKLEVDIGWQRFQFVGVASSSGCLDQFHGSLAHGDGFGEGIFREGASPYGNGASGAADAMVGLFVCSAAVCLFMYKTLKMSYHGPGSIYSVGLDSTGKLCLLFSIANAFAVGAFWGRVSGRLGSLSDSLANTFFDAVMDACMSDWDTSCNTEPWEFDPLGYVFIMAFSQAGLLLLTSFWMCWRSGLVEGILDGSKYKDGKACTPRVVEYENAVGCALATTEDPDYDTDNALYSGSLKDTMVRPYPLPFSAKAVKEKNKTERAPPSAEVAPPDSKDTPTTSDEMSPIPEHNCLEAGLGESQPHP
ncbi:unnamed protein product [Discosporangium mesarthrocarpum]